MLLALSLWFKLFFVLTPFFAMTMFLSLTEGYTETHRRRLAITVSMAVGLIGLILFFAGHQVFAAFGITLDSFRVGAGALLFLSGIELARGKAVSAAAVSDGDVAVVPLAIPIIVGPATAGTLLVLGAELTDLSTKVIGATAFILAVLSVCAILLSSSAIQRLLGTRGIAILSRITGLVLTALAAQMMMTGLRAFLLISA